MNVTIEAKVVFNGVSPSEVVSILQANGVELTMDKVEGRNYMIFDRRPTEFKPKGGKGSSALSVETRSVASGGR